MFDAIFLVSMRGLRVSTDHGIPGALGLSRLFGYRGEDENQIWESQFTPFGGK